MRERFFSVFGPKVIDSRVLDLYAGTGAVGIEALSRGAAHAVFVEAHRSAAKLIRSNLESLDVSSDFARVINRPAARAIAVLVRPSVVFDLVWADPPFHLWRDGAEILDAAVAANLISDQATLCLECPAEAAVEEVLSSRLEIVRDLKGGASRVVILRSK